MTQRNPLVVVGGEVKELPLGDTLVATGRTDTANAWGEQQTFEKSIVVNMPLSGNAIEVDHTGATGTLLRLKSGGVLKAHISKDGSMQLMSGLTVPYVLLSSPSSTSGNCYSGPYTPTLTNTTNITSSTAHECQFLRLGDVATVSGRVNINATASGRVVMSMTLPVASDITSSSQVGGTISLYTTASVVANGCISGVAASNSAEIRLVAASSGDASYWFQFTYRIL